MSKLEDFTGTAGMNAGASVYAKMMRTTDIQTDPGLSGIFPIAEEKLETGEWTETGAADTSGRSIVAASRLFYPVRQSEP